MGMAPVSQSRALPSSIQAEECRLQDLESSATVLWDVIGKSSCCPQSQALKALCLSSYRATSPEYVPQLVSASLALFCPAPQGLDCLVKGCGLQAGIGQSPCCPSLLSSFPSVLPSSSG